MKFQPTSDMPVSKVMAGTIAETLGPGCFCETLTCALQDGLEILYWRGNFEQLQEIPLIDDSNRICFSFNRCVSGGAECLFNEHGAHRYEFCKNSGSIQYGPGRRGVYRQHGEVRNLSVMMHPDLFETWVEKVDPCLRQVLACGGVLESPCNAELLATAQILGNALFPQEKKGHATTQRHPLWLQAQCMSFVGLFLEARTQAPARKMTPADRKRLLRARDILLSDLSRVPSIGEVAREVGLSAPTLTRGFHQLFGTSPYALFQQERMQAARGRLMSGPDSVMRVASELGYTNPSHFSEAFRKQFGILPGEVKRQRRV